MSRQLPLVLLSILAMAMSGCTSPAIVTLSDVDDTRLMDDGLISGPMSHSWDWNVEEGAKYMEICIAFSSDGDKTAAILGPVARLTHTHPNGFEVHSHRDLIAGSDGCWFEWHEVEAGAWQLELGWDGGRGTWNVEIEVSY